MHDVGPARNLLAEMREVSLARVRALEHRFGLAALLRCAEDGPRPRPLALDPRFDVIAEIKRRAPSSGALAPDASEAHTVERMLVERAHAYAAGGAAVISVLTESTRFAGELDHLRVVSNAVDVPVLRKDFLVDPLQVVEARMAGADGVLLIARLLDDDTLAACLDVAHSLALFVLLEAFDRDDLARIRHALHPSRAGFEALVGVNTRDLATLAVDEARLEDLVDAFPEGARPVAESGLHGPRDAARAAALGYRAALVGTALMRAADPAALVAAMVAAGRDAAPRRSA